MPSVIGIRTNIRPCPPRSPNCHVSPELSSLCYISLMTLLLSLSIYISFHHPSHAFCPPKACLQTLFYNIPPPLPRDAIAPHPPAHCATSHIFLFRLNLPWRNVLYLRHSVDLCKLSTYMLFLRTSYTSTRCLFMFGEHNTMKSKLYWNGSLTDNLDIIKYVIRST